MLPHYDLGTAAQAADGHRSGACTGYLIWLQNSASGYMGIGFVLLATECCDPHRRSSTTDDECDSNNTVPAG